MYAILGSKTDELRESMIAAGFGLEPVNQKAANVDELPTRDRLLAKLILKAKDPSAARGIKVKKSDLSDPQMLSVVLHRAGLTLYGLKGDRTYLTIGRSKRRRKAA